MNKPAFFISSTIYDFSDLRSSLKWWLEENNYSVNASDFNDFDKPLDRNSYDACLSAIENSDYFILIIGDRIGGMYDEYTTITQKEYQFAYELMLKGNIKIINLIRKETWTNFNGFKAKIKELKNRDNLNSNLIDNLLSTEEKIRFNFIDEVRRVQEMKEGKLPMSNWIHNFTTFSEIISILKIQLGGKLDLKYKQNRFIALGDIKSNLIQICKKTEKEIYPIAYLSDEIWQDFSLDLKAPDIIFTDEEYSSYGYFYISCLQIKPLRINRLESLYKLGFFLKYDKNSNDFISGKLNNLAIDLINSYDRINNLHKTIYKDQGVRLVSLSRKKDNSHLKGTKFEIFLALEFRDHIENCINLSINLYHALVGNNFSIPILKNLDRLPKKMQPKIENIITEKEITVFIEKLGQTH